MAADLDTLDQQLASVHIVLVAPRSAGNIGGAARAMANNGLGRLVLVAPPAFDPDRARWMAPGVHERIDSALIVGSVAEAIDSLDVVRVVGTSARAKRCMIRQRSSKRSRSPPIYSFISYRWRSVSPELRSKT